MAYSADQKKALLSQALLKATHEFEAPPICLEIAGDFGNQIFATLGNFSTILARPKVGKTTFTAIAVSSLLSGLRTLQFVPYLPNKRKNILWIDTEQGKPECVKTIRFLSKLVNEDETKHPDNFYFLSFRQFNYTQRIELTEYAINYFPDLSFVVIDGIRDFVSSINDEREATAIADKLLKWTQEKNIHILTILHQNKGDANARGHLGSELMNKAETVAKLSREENTGTRLTIVEPEFTRHRDFETFAYSIDDAGILTGESATQGYQPHDPKVHELTLEQITTLLRSTFKNSNTLGYRSVWTSFQSILKKELEIEFGVNKCKELVTWLKSRHYLRKNETTKLYEANLPPE